MLCAVDPDHVGPLAKMVFDRTGGNPFFAIHFICTGACRGRAARLRYGKSALGLGPAADSHKEFADNVADLMASKLGRLPRRRKRR